ncbi:hypothetical protein ACJ6WD_10665 [Streptomyces sp. VTCC 41912]|uniref:hypothetical protein n=1 Tax=Streptomyces sp. VTCC 41912 TaxID=3383243 RepID=UPI003896EB9D
MRTYKIVREQAMGTFLCPPGFHGFTYSVNEFAGPRGRKVIGEHSLEYLLSDEADASEYVRKEAARLIGLVKPTESEGWVRSVYGYYKHCYVPESESRNGDDLIIHNPTEIVVDRAFKALDSGVAHVREEANARARLGAPDDESLPRGKNPMNYRRGVTPVYGRRRGYEVTARRDGSTVYVYALADDGVRYDADHLSDYADALRGNEQFDNVRHQPMCDEHAGRIVADVRDVPARMDPERHAAVSCVRQYFPGHQPRLDLIENPTKGYGSWPCSKCGERVQYEAKFDKHAVVTTRIDGRGMTHWSYGLECADGEPHEVK